MRQAVLRKKDRTGFQDFVNARHKWNAYDIMNCMPIGSGPRGAAAVEYFEEHSEHSSEGGGEGEHPDLLHGFAKLFQSMKRIHAVGTRNPIKDSIMIHRTVLEKKREHKVL